MLWSCTLPLLGLLQKYGGVSNILNESFLAEMYLCPAAVGATASLLSFLCKSKTTHEYVTIFVSIYEIPNTFASSELLSSKLNIRFR